MQNNMFRKNLVFGIIMLFVGASFGSGISGKIGNKNEISTPILKTSSTDWWPMLHHDLNHSGYSTSKAPDTNNVKWTYITDGSLDSSPAVADGKVYFGSGEYPYKVYCLNANTGSKIWSYSPGGYVSSSPAVADGKVYFGSDDYKVYCLNANTGSKIWSYTTGSYVYSSPAVADGKVYIGSNDYKVYCLNANTGAKIWDYTTDNTLYLSSPAVADGKVYIGSGDYKMYCLNANTGAKIWSYTTGSWVYSSPAVADGKVYFGSNDYKVYCLNANTGSKIWEYTTGEKVWSSPAVADGKVYFGSNDRNVYCLNANTGAKIWNYTQGGTFFLQYSYPAVADGKVYIGACTSKVYCLNASTGSKIWIYQTGGHVHSSPAVADGKVYIGSNDYKMYCFGNQPLVFGSPTPANGSTGQPLAFTWSIPISDPEGDSFNWSINCSNGDSNSSNNDFNGTKKLSISGLEYSTEYTVWVNATDSGSGDWTKEWFTFTTKLNNPPVLDHENPANGSTDIPVTISSLSVNIEDPEGDSFDWSIETSPDIGSNSGSSENNGTKTCGVSGLDYDTTYTWFVNATDPDGSGLYTREWFTFTIQESEPQPFNFIHITDTHIDASDDSWGSAVRLFDTLEYIRYLEPSPDFVVISGDLVEVGNKENYDRFKTRFFKNTDSYQLFIDPSRTIPAYICPGNHDHRRDYLLKNYDDILKYPNDDDLHCYFEQLQGLDVQIFSIASGADLLIPEAWIPPNDPFNWRRMPEGEGLSPTVINWLKDNLDNSKMSIIFLHHPVMNKYSVWDDGCIRWNKDDLLSFCRDNHIGLILSGHTHGAYPKCGFDVYEHSGTNPQKEITYYFDGDDNGHHYYLTYDRESSYTRTLNVQTLDTAKYYAYRKISVDGDEIKVYAYGYAKPTGNGGITWRIGQGLRNKDDSRIANLHIYDSQGNHIGENEIGGFDFEIEGGYYSPLIDFNETIYGVQASINFGEDDYIFKIEGIENGFVDVKFDYLTGGVMGDISSYYSNLSIMNSSIGKLYVKMDSINHTIYMDDDGDGVVDREIEPTNITTPPPYKPAKPDGPTSGRPGVEYTYTTSTTDSNGDNIYYWFDWGDGTNSGWIGPYSSGDTCTASHEWKKKGSYQVRVKSKDIYDCESPWSDQLEIIIPRNKPFIFNFDLLSWFFERFPILFKGLLYRVK